MINIKFQQMIYKFVLITSFSLFFSCAPQKIDIDNISFREEVIHFNSQSNKKQNQIVEVLIYSFSNESTQKKSEELLLLIPYERLNQILLHRLAYGKLKGNQQIYLSDDMKDYKLKLVIDFVIKNHKGFCTTGQIHEKTKSITSLLEQNLYIDALAELLTIESENIFRCNLDAIYDNTLEEADNEFEAKLNQVKIFRENGSCAISRDLYNNLNNKLGKYNYFQNRLNQYKPLVDSCELNANLKQEKKMKF